MRKVPKDRCDNVRIETEEGTFTLFINDRCALTHLHNAFTKVIPANPGYVALAYTKPYEESESFWCGIEEIVGWRIEERGTEPVFLPSALEGDCDAILCPDGTVREFEEAPLPFAEWKAKKEKEWAATHPQ
jgi:hypothetical protein